MHCNQGTRFLFLTTAQDPIGRQTDGSFKVAARVCVSVNVYINGLFLCAFSMMSRASNENSVRGREKGKELENVGALMLCF